MAPATPRALQVWLLKGRRGWLVSPFYLLSVAAQQIDQDDLFDEFDPTTRMLNRLDELYSTPEDSEQTSKIMRKEFGEKWTLIAVEWWGKVLPSEPLYRGYQPRNLLVKHFPCRVVEPKVRIVGQ